MRLVARIAHQRRAQQRDRTLRTLQLARTCPDLAADTQMSTREMLQQLCSRRPILPQSSKQTKESVKGYQCEQKEKKEWVHSTY